MYILAADFGTSSVKTAILDENSQVVSAAKRSYDFKVIDQIKIEIDVGELMDAFFATLQELKRYLPEVKAVCFDAFAPSLVLMDGQGRAISNIITHLDRRSRAYTKKIIDSFGKDRFMGITGTLPHAGGVTLTTLLWLMEHCPEIIKKTEKIGHLTTYLFHQMTGLWATDTVNASVMGLYETMTDTGWSEEIYGHFGLPERILPPVYRAGELDEKLRENFSERSGLPSGIPVVLGTQDVASAIIGAGNCAPGDVLFISGSSEMISVLSDRPVTNEKYYLRASPVKGTWQIFSITTAGFALEWFRQEFYRDMSETEFYQEHFVEVVGRRFKTGGATFLPFLTGDRQSLRKKTGSFNGLRLDTTRDDMLCALVEGIQSPAKQTLAECAKIIPISKVMKATGNLVEHWEYLKRKKELFDNAEIKVTDNCPLKGCAVLCLNALGNGNASMTGGE